MFVQYIQEKNIFGDFNILIMSKKNIFIPFRDNNLPTVLPVLKFNITFSIDDKEKCNVKYILDSINGKNKNLAFC